MKKLFLCMIITATLIAPVHARDVGGYNVEELTNEDGDPNKKPFTIIAIDRQSGQLRIWIQPQYGGISDIARQMSKLEAQVSDAEGAENVTLTLNKAIECKDYGTVHLNYSAEVPSYCEVTGARYYLIAPVTLKKGRDLGIGIDPDNLWFLEKK